jgi:DNA-binding NarL/FixJ family response regulator
MRPVRLIVADDHALVRRGIVETMAEAPDFEVVGEAACRSEAVALAGALLPDLVMLDVTMPGGGIEAAAEIRATLPSACVVMLSVRDDARATREALAAGASAYVVKGIDGAQLVAILRGVMEHRVLVLDGQSRGLCY